MKKETRFSPEQVLEFWFPVGGDADTPDQNAAFWTSRMQGGMDAAIIENFEPLARAAAAGALDHWAETPRGRLALLIALDQFPRSLWRDTPAAFAQDILAARLALDGIANGDIDKLSAREATFFVIAISHCEGPDHLQRMEALDTVVEGIVARIPPQLPEAGERLWAQHRRVTEIIRRFGRHPHRNPILSRISTPDEELYIAEGRFPHLPDPAS